jgi:hypothetical protein
MDFYLFYAISIWKCVILPQSGFVTTMFGEEVVAVYQAWDTWHTSMALQKEMDKCVTYFFKIGFVVA